MHRTEVLATRHHGRRTKSLVYFAWRCRKLLYLLLGLYIAFSFSQLLLLQQSHPDLEICAQHLEVAGLPIGGSLTSGEPSSHVLQERVRLYQKLSRELSHTGLAVGGVITQGVRQSDLFHVEWDLARGSLQVVPTPVPLQVPVRAVVLPVLDQGVPAAVQGVLKQHLQPLVLPGSIWFQDPVIYHSTLYHASTHTHPRPASEEEIMVEGRRVADVAKFTCPVEAILDKVVLSKSGVVLLCWQVLRGGDPYGIREELRKVLKDSPGQEGQMVKDPIIFHTTAARLLSPLNWDSLVPSTNMSLVSPNASTPLQLALKQINKELCGMRVTFTEMWLVEEPELLALAVRGRYTKHTVAPLLCQAGHQVV